MLARSALCLRGLAAVGFVALSSQCRGPDHDHGRSPQSHALALEVAAEAEPEVQIVCDEAPGNRKGIQLTLRTRQDKAVQFSFPDGSDELTLVKGVAATATFVYDEAGKQVILVLDNGTARKGPRVVPTRGSYNPVLDIKPLGERPARPIPGWKRTFVTARNYGLEFSILYSIRS